MSFTGVLIGVLRASPLVGFLDGVCEMPLLAGVFEAFEMLVLAGDFEGVSKALPLTAAFLGVADGLSFAGVLKGVFREP